jgi:DNA-binding response OmpR family regulator
MRKILIVEDDFSNQNLIKFVSEKIGYEPIVVDTVKEALSILKQDKTIETAIVDMELKDGWGVNLINQVRVKFAIDIQIIVYSGNLDILNDWLDSSITLDATIQKGSGIEVLKQKLKELWCLNDNKLKVI